MKFDERLHMKCNELVQSDRIQMNKDTTYYAEWFEK